MHHEVNENGFRITNDLFRTEKSDLIYQMVGLNVYFFPDEPETALKVQEVAKQAAEIGQDDPTWGLYSAADAQNGPVLDQLATDTTLAIITGRESIDALDGALDEWRSRGGDQIRQEYEEALQQS